MTPKEKAKELVDKYLLSPIDFPYTDTQDGQCIGKGSMLYNSAKQCALIAVDEIINNNSKIPGILTEYTMHNTWFWQEVKQEIEKL